LVVVDNEKRRLPVISRRSNGPSENRRRDILGSEGSNPFFISHQKAGIT
jgi:hypothetical protein